jgi:hypothetical protein
MQDSVNGIRKELSALVEIKRNDRNTYNMKRERLLRKYKIETKENLDQVIEELKQKVSAKTQRLFRYKKRQRQYYQKKMFRTDCKKFYNFFRHTNTNVKKAPRKEDIESFWRTIFGEKVWHNEEAYWIKNQHQQNSCMEWRPISETEVTMALQTTPNWKAPGRDQIPNFWLKQLMAKHKYLATLFNKLIEEDQTPEWLMAGVTLLIPKNNNTEKPKNYRPVTCLPTIYKLITSIISKQTQSYIDDQNLMPKEQKGCCRGSKGCKDQLLISKSILQECKCRKKNLCMAWIDYQKVLTGYHTVG